jgi:hypothetical protein
MKQNDAPMFQIGFPAVTATTMKRVNFHDERRLIGVITDLPNQLTAFIFKVRMGVKNRSDRQRGFMHLINMILQPPVARQLMGLCPMCRRTGKAVQNFSQNLTLVKKFLRKCHYIFRLMWPSSGFKTSLHSITRTDHNK